MVLNMILRLETLLIHIKILWEFLYMIIELLKLFLFSYG
jgi:hypothetical protein